MTHDRLCPAHPNLTNIPCYCGLILRVREQEQAQEERAYWRGYNDALANVNGGAS